MGYDGAEIQTFNASKAIAQSRDLQLILWHNEAMRQARTGETPEKKMDDLTDNQRKLNQVRALSLVISAQRELINISRSQVKFRSINQWKKDHNSEKEQLEHPFKEHKNDYNDLIYLKDKLYACEMDIIDAEKSVTKDDDFLIIKEKSDGDFYELTQNFREMLMELEDSYEDIHLLMLTNKIISAGIEENEELTYKEKEEEMKRRIVDA